MTLKSLLDEEYMSIIPLNIASQDSHENSYFYQEEWVGPALKHLNRWLIKQKQSRKKYSNAKVLTAEIIADACSRKEHARSFQFESCVGLWNILLLCDIYSLFYCLTSTSAT